MLPDGADDCSGWLPNTDDEVVDVVVVDVPKMDDDAG